MLFLAKHSVLLAEHSDLFCLWQYASFYAHQRKVIQVSRKKLSKEKTNLDYFSAQVRLHLHLILESITEKTLL